MEQAADLFWKPSTDVETFKLGAELRASPVLGVMLKGDRRRRFGVVHFLTDIRNVLFQAVECRVDKILFGSGVVFFRKIAPVFEAGVC